MKYLKITSLITVVLAIYWWNQSPELEHSNTSVELTSVAGHNVVAKKSPVIDKNTEKQKIQQKVDKYDRESEIFQLLQAPEDHVLEDTWQEEYGCFNKDNNNEHACKHSFLNARSYKEALWMKNNGYPTMSMLNLIHDPEMQAPLREMAHKSYPAALALESIAAIEREDFQQASIKALANLAVSDNAQTYPYYLYGEVLLAKGSDIMAVGEFYMAGILGDYQAQDLAANLSPDNYFATSALDHAHTVLRRRFGGSVPRDPRPKYGE